MPEPPRRPFSITTLAIYTALRTYGRPMTVRRLSNELGGIRTQRVYESIRPLLQAGLVRGGKVITQVYYALPDEQARYAYRRYSQLQFEHWLLHGANTIQSKPQSRAASANGKSTRS